MENLKQAPKFSTKKRVQWGVASFGGSIISGIYGALLPIFYLDYLGLTENAAIIYLIQVVYVVVNALNDPLFGILSDRSKLKKGRRIPFMRYTAPFLALTFVLIWFSPNVYSGEWAIFWWMVIMTCLYDTAYTIIFLVYSALLPEVTEDEQERNGLQVFASFFNLLGMIIGFLIPEIVRDLGAGLLITSMIVVGIVVAVLIMYTTYQFEERPEFQVVDEPLGFIDSLKYTFKSKSFIVLVSANFMGILVQSLVIGSIYFLADYVVQTTSIVLLVFVFIPLILGIWLTPKLIHKWGVVKADQYLLIISGIGLCLLTFMPINELIYLCLAIASIGFIGPIVFTNVMFAQVADEDELRTGVRREAVFFGINALITKPAQSLALVIPTALLTLASFKPRIGDVIILDQPPGVFIAIRVFIGLIPGIAFLLASFILRYYPIKGEYWEKIQKEILIIHEEKHSKLKEMGR